MPSDRARAVKARQQAMWASGDFAVIGTTLQIVGELPGRSGGRARVHRVLDVAAGNGNATLAAARRFATVTSTDYVPALLERGRRRAEAEGFASVAFEVADAESLPYPDASFDVVLSTFGVDVRARSPTARRPSSPRVCRPGGRIGLANWTPSGFLGELLRLVAEVRAAGPRRSVSRSCGARTLTSASCSPAPAGSRTATRSFAFRYRSAHHWVQTFRDFYGPTHTAFLALEADGRAALEADLIALLRSRDVGGPDGLVVHAEYLETVITR